MKTNYALNEIAQVLKSDRAYLALDFITFHDETNTNTDLVINTPLSNCWVHEVLDWSSDDITYIITDK